jgi:hypothetical protein
MCHCSIPSGEGLRAINACAHRPDSCIRTEVVPIPDMSRSVYPHPRSVVPDPMHNPEKLRPRARKPNFRSAFVVSLFSSPPHPS